jgi:hypothetical protein
MPLCVKNLEYVPLRLPFRTHDVSSPGNGLIFESIAFLFFTFHFSLRYLLDLAFLRAPDRGSRDNEQLSFSVPCKPSHFNCASE